jgi:hypothetical protein
MVIRNIRKFVESSLLKDHHENDRKVVRRTSVTNVDGSVVDLEPGDLLGFDGEQHDGRMAWSVLSSDGKSKKTLILNQSDARALLGSDAVEKF